MDMRLAMELDLDDMENTIAVGTLEDGRKITVAMEVASRCEETAEDSGVIVFVMGIHEPEPALEIGSTIMEFSITDETGMTTYRGYIASIE